MKIDQTAKDSLPTLGPTVRARLAEVGLDDRKALAAVGAVAAFQRLKAAAGERPTPRCYYLFGLDAALRGLRWNELPATRRAALAREAGELGYRPRVR